MRMIDNMFPFEVFNNRKGIGPAVSSLIVLVVTIIAMGLVIGMSQNIISAHASQMGENLTIEKVLTNSTHINLYLRNTGYGDITLDYIIINDDIEELQQKVIVPYNVDNLKEDVIIYSIDIEVVPEYSGIVSISFVSVNNNHLGKVEFELER
jgi:hypothetical protein